MAQEDVQTNVRLPADLKAWLEKQAAQSRRSLTAEVVIALEQYRTRQEVADAKP
jgi:predicted transcriptional regulator